jgi:hypothetical protein
VYFSESALNEVDDARYTRSSGYSAGFTGKLVSLTRETTVALNQPGSADLVNFALARAQKAGRPTRHSAHDVTGTGTVFDIEVDDLHVGVLPFLYFGKYGEQSPAGRVRVFWAQTVVSPRRRHSADSPRELILLGSLNKVTNKPWSGAHESALKIGHAYPSDPSVLSRLVCAELQLDDASVRSHIDTVERFETPEPGCYARFASQQTARARKAVWRDEGFITRWERRRPLRRARVVAITSDVCDSSEDADAESALLARPILIRDLSP